MGDFYLPPSLANFVVPRALCFHFPDAATVARLNVPLRDLPAAILCHPVFLQSSHKLSQLQNELLVLWPGKARHAVLSNIIEPEDINGAYCRNGGACLMHDPSTARPDTNPTRLKGEL